MEKTKSDRPTGWGKGIYVYLSPLPLLLCTYIPLVYSLYINSRAPAVQGMEN